MPKKLKSKINKLKIKIKTIKKNHNWMKITNIIKWKCKQ